MLLDLPRAEWTKAFKEAGKLATKIIVNTNKNKKMFKKDDPNIFTETEMKLALVIIAFNEYRLEKEAESSQRNILFRQILNVLTSKDCEQSFKDRTINNIHRHLKKNPGMGFLDHVKEMLDILSMYAQPSFYKENRKPWLLAQDKIKRMEY